MRAGFSRRASDLLEHPPHADGEGLDLAQPPHGVGGQRALVEEQQLGLGQQGRERVGEVVAELLDARCEGDRLCLSTSRGEVIIGARFAQLSLAELAFRIRDAKRLALWGRLSRPSLLRTQN